MASYEPWVPNEETRKRLISEATQAFLAEGYGAAKLDAIAKSAQISKKTIYKYVASKADLFVIVVQDALGSIPVQGLLAAADDDDPEATLRQFLVPVAALGLSEAGLRFHWMIIKEASNFPELIPAFSQAISGFLQGLTSWIEGQVQRGWLNVESPSRAASALLTLLLEETRRGFALGLRDAPSWEEQAQMIDFTVKLFLHGALRRSAVD